MESRRLKLGGQEGDSFEVKCVERWQSRPISDPLVVMSEFERLGYGGVFGASM